MSARYGLGLHAKHENLAHVRSFKARGAVFRLAQLSEPARKTGVVTASTGNHGMAFAYAAQLFDTSVVVVAPTNAEQTKLERAIAFGAEVRQTGATLGDAIDAARAISEEENLVFVEDGDDPSLVLGAGTIALEVLDELPHTDILLVPIGGGNLAAGIAACAKKINNKIRIIGVQSELAPAVYESWKAGSVIYQPASTFAGGLAADFPGKLALRLISDYIDDIVLVSDHELRVATALALTEIGETLEGAGAATLAALERYHARWAGDNVVAVLSGGNASRDEIEHALKSTPATWLTSMQPAP